MSGSAATATTLSMIDEVGHDSNGGRFGEFDCAARFATHRDVRRYLSTAQPSGGASPLDDAVHLWWSGPELPTGQTPCREVGFMYLNREGSYRYWEIQAPGRAYDLPRPVVQEAAFASPAYDAYVQVLAEGRATAMCLADSLGLAQGSSMASVCVGDAAPAGEACAWATGIAGLREEARHYGSTPELHLSTFPAAYLLECHVGMHRDARTSVPEFISERFSRRMSRLSPTARAAARTLNFGSQGRVVTPEFHHRWLLRTCEDVAHMAWPQVAHCSPRLTPEEQLLGSAGGGVVKFVGS
jgi:hypothetical protein